MSEKHYIVRGKKLRKDRKMTYPVTDREVEEFIYNAFERQNPPSIFKMALDQLKEEGFRFDTARNLRKNWDRLIDRALAIREKLDRKEI